MRQMEGRAGANTDPEWRPGVPFVRRGEVGSHRDEMPAETLAHFMLDAEATLRATGYLDG
jgi:hypothetical protein